MTLSKSPSPIKKTIRTTISWTAVLILLGAALRVYGWGRDLGAQDEQIILLGYVYTDIIKIVTTYFTGMSHHIFHSILLRGMVVLFGEDNAYAIRFPALISGIACLWIIFQIAVEIYQDIRIGRLALLIAGLSPIHIYYSQTARGYSLALFLTTLALYACIQILKAKHYLTWGLTLALSGFLSVYTIPTNVYFLFGLGAWLLLVFFVPSLGQSLGLNQENKAGKRRCFLYVTIAIPILSLAAYSPVLSQMALEAKSEQTLLNEMYHFDPNALFPQLSLFVSLIGKLFIKIFPESLVGFAPFILVGIFTSTLGSAYRWLPVSILFIPFLISAITGVAGWPRIYLFNFPLLAIFLSGGIFEVGRMATSFRPKLGEIISYGLATLFVAFSAKILIIDYYPSIQTNVGKQYLKNVQAQTQPEDLVLFADPKNYLYARTVFANNLQSIFNQNRLQDIHIVAKDANAIQTFQVEKSGNAFAIFKDRFQNLAPFPLTKNLNLFSLTSGPGRALLPEDFEIKSPWKLIQGQGKVAAYDQQKLSGIAALQLKTDSGFVIEAQIAKSLNLVGYHLAVLIWSGKNLDENSDNFIAPPILMEPTDGSPRWVLKTGSINQGNRVTLKQWPLVSFIGMVPPGDYHLHLQLAAGPNQNILFDGLRLFLIPLA